MQGPRRRVLLVVAAIGAAGIAACSGGGSSSPSPTPGPELGGIGAALAFDQKANFTVIVPPATVAAAARRRRHAAGAATNPYVSPNVASISLQVAAVNGESPRTVPASTVVNISCGTANGCSVPIQNVPAATGLDHFSVETFSGTNATGNIISLGFVDVTVPSAQATSFGGTALSIGGYVASISLALNVPNHTFYWHTAAQGTVDVNAVDPAGAVIIGSDQLADPISVSLPVTDGSAFTLNGAQQLTLQRPAQSLTLAYNGTVLEGGSVSASTTDENSQPVSTSIPIPVGPTPTPVPTPTPSMPPRPPFSLYVYDAAADRILEYAGLNSVEGGQPLSTTPRRIFEVAAPSSIAPNLVNCTAYQGAPMLAGLAVGSDGTIYAQTFCTDAATSTQGYSFTYTAATQEAVPTQGSPTPPPPAGTITIANVGLAQGLTVDNTNGVLYEAYQPTSYQPGANVVGVSTKNTAQITSNFGSVCLQQFGSPACTSTQSSGFGGFPLNIAVDPAGNVYVPNYWSAYDANGNVFTPPGPASQEVSAEPAVLVFPPGSTNPAPTPMSALAGFGAELGGTNLSPAGISVEGSTLYVLANPQTITDPANGNTVYPGLSGCPAPSASAVPDTLQTLCPNSGLADYLLAYADATMTLTGASNAGTNVGQAPSTMLGGDLVGGFGNISSATGANLVVRNGYAYVLNSYPTSGVGTEVDVYDLNGVSGYHTDIPPVTKLVFDASITPTTIAIGPTGTGVGGQALLRRPARVHHDIRAWIRTLERLRHARERGMRARK